MKKFKNTLKEIKLINIIFLTLGGIINAIGVTLFLSPSNILDGGLSGTSLLIDKLTPSYLTLSIFLIVLNFPFYIFAHKKNGPIFTIYSLYAISIYSLFAFIFKITLLNRYTGPGSPIAGNDLFLCAIFGGLLSGIGSGLTIRFGGALDGIEVMAVLFSKKIGLTVGKFVMIYNIILYLISGFILGSWEIVLYSIVAYYVGIKTVDLLVEGLDKAKSVVIITKKYEDLCDLLSIEFGRGLTILDAKGYYSNENKYVIYCVVNRFEIPKLKRIIRLIDDSSFVSINDTSDTMGSSFKFKIKK